MNKKVLILLGFVSQLTLAEVTTLEDLSEKEDYEKKIEESYIRGSIAYPTAITKAKETVDRLTKNRIHIETLESDPNYVNCVLTKEMLKKITSLEESAAILVKEGRLAESEFNTLKQDKSDQKETLQKELTLNKCN